MMPSIVPTAWRLLSLVRRGCGLALILAVSAGTASAHHCTPHSPEIDAGSLATAVGLVTGGVLLLTDRLRRR